MNPPADAPGGRPLHKGNTSGPAEPDPRCSLEDDCKEMSMKWLLGCLIAILAPLAQAHVGHGMVGPHWHATDVLGFVVLGVIVAAALWASHRT
jgi:hypothetical protein